MNQLPEQDGGKINDSPKEGNGKEDNIIYINMLVSQIRKMLSSEIPEDRYQVEKRTFINKIEPIQAEMERLSQLYFTILNYARLRGSQKALILIMKGLENPDNNADTKEVLWQAAHKILLVKDGNRTED